jgi:hypothetical protein
MRRFVAIAAASCLVIGITSYAYTSRRFGLLCRAGRYTVEVNGAAVHGGVLAGRSTAVVTRRDKGKEHSYLLLYAGDIDQTGDVGQVIDCGEWIAPKLPILIRTSNYPNCEQRSTRSRISLMSKGTTEQFTTTEQDVISIRR